MKTISWCLFEKIRDREKYSGCSYIVMLYLGILTCKKASTCTLWGWHWYKGRILVSCIGISLTLKKFPSEAAIPGWIQWGFCPSSVWDQGFVCAWCVLCTLQTAVCRSGLCASFLGEVKYLFWCYLIFISLDIKMSAALHLWKLMLEVCGKSELKIHLWLGINMNHVVFKSRLV